MPKINVYLPDDLATAVRRSAIPVSSVCQRALEEALRTLGAVRESTRSVDAATGRLARFTPRVKEALTLARGQAVRRGHGSVGTGHLLLGILDEGANLAVRVLEVLGVEPADVAAELEAVIVATGGADGRGVEADEIGLSPGATAVCQLATREALRLGHNYVGCEHLLVALVAEGDGVAGQVLRGMGLELVSTRRTVVAALAGFVHRSANPPRRGGSDALLREVLARLDRLEQRLAG